MRDRIRNRHQRDRSPDRRNRPDRPEPRRSRNPGDAIERDRIFGGGFNRRERQRSSRNVRHPGATIAQIEDLPVSEYVAPTNPNANTLTSCPVCLEDFEAGDHVRTLPCFHFFHKECIDQWLKQNAICPIDKQSMIPTGRASGRE